MPDSSDDCPSPPAWLAGEAAAGDGWHAALAQMPPDVEEMLAARGARQLNLYRALSSSPEMARAWRGFIWSLRDHCVVTPRLLRELMILRTAVRHACLYEWHHHRLMAENLGEEKLAAVADWRESDVFGEDERAVLALADAVCDGNVPGSVAGQVAARFGDRGLVELVVTAGAYVMVPRVLSALGVEIESGEES